MPLANLSDLDQIEEAGHPLIQHCTSYGERTWHLPLGYRRLPPIAVTPYKLMSLYVAKRNFNAKSLSMSLPDARFNFSLQAFPFFQQKGA